MLETGAGKHFVLLLTLLQDSFKYVLQVMILYFMCRTWCRCYGLRADLFSHFFPRWLQLSETGSGVCLVCTECSASSVLFIAVDPSLSDFILLRKITKYWKLALCCCWIMKQWHLCAESDTFSEYSILHHTQKSIVVSRKYAFYYLLTWIAWWSLYLLLHGYVTHFETVAYCKNVFANKHVRDSNICSFCTKGYFVNALRLHTNGSPLFGAVTTL